MIKNFQNIKMQILNFKRHKSLIQSQESTWGQGAVERESMNGVGVKRDEGGFREKGMEYIIIIITQKQSTCDVK